MTRRRSGGWSLGGAAGWDVVIALCLYWSEADHRPDNWASGELRVDELTAQVGAVSTAGGYSKYDSGCALETPQELDCRGYNHESAANILIYGTLH